MFQWLRKALGSTSQPRKRARAVALRLERLEERDTPADTLTVQHLGDSGAGSLRATILAASDDDTIIFGANAQGTIQLNAGLVLNKRLTITGGGSVTIRGAGIEGYQGPEPLDERIWFRIFTVTEPCTLSGLTIHEGWTEDSGGAISNTSALTLSNVSIYDCGADGFGGAIFNDNDADLSIAYSSIAYCQAIAGGGIHNVGASLTMTNSGIYYCVATDSGGGGIFHEAGTASLLNTDIVGCSAAITGGGIVAFDEFIMGGGSIYGNSAGTYGGGIFIGFEAGVSLGAVDVTWNTATDLGGGFYVADGTLVVDGGTLQDNTAQGNAGTAGGAIDTDDGSLVFTTFWDGGWCDCWDEV